MATFTITSKAGAEMGTYEGETALHAYAAMLRDAGYSARVEGILLTDAPGGDQSGEMIIREVESEDGAVQAIDSNTGRALGAASEALVAASEAAGDTGAVGAYRDREGVWQPLAEHECDEYRRDGYEVRTVYVSA